MKLDIFNQKGESTSNMTLSKEFSSNVSNEAVTLYINYLRNALRAPIANTKDRSEVSGGGKKPWRQKGTGSARVGSTRSPLWVGGGVTFGPTNARNFTTRINKNLKKKTILSVISEFVTNKKVKVVENLSFDKPSTKDAIALLDKLGVTGKIVVIANRTDKFSYESFRNLPYVEFMESSKPNLISVIPASYLIFSKNALEEIEELYKAK